MKKILIISYTYQQEHLPRAIRWRALVNHLRKKGYQIHLITSGSGVSSLDTDENLFLVNDFFYSNKKLTKRKSLTSFFSKVFRWPDHAWKFILNAYCLAKKLHNKNEYDACITVSHPFSSNVVGFLLKMKYKQIDWISDNGDPFSIMKQPRINNFLFYGWLNWYFERKVIFNTKKFIVTTAETKNLYAKSFKGSNHKIAVIGPFLEEEVLNLLNTPKSLKIRHSEIKFIFIGTLYSGIRNPNHVIKILEVLQKLIPQKIIIEFIGDLSGLNEEDLSSSAILVKHKQALPRKDALHRFLEADILVNIGNTNSYQLPSKVIEYLASNKPIINFSSIQNDSSKSLLSQFEATINICAPHLDEMTAAELLKEFIEKLNNSETKISRNMKTFSINEASNAFQEII